MLCHIVILGKFEQNVLHQTYCKIFEDFMAAHWPVRESGLWKALPKRLFQFLGNVVPVLSSVNINLIIDYYGTLEKCPRFLEKCKMDVSCGVLFRFVLLVCLLVCFSIQLSICKFMLAFKWVCKAVKKKKEKT